MAVTPSRGRIRSRNVLSAATWFTAPSASITVANWGVLRTVRPNWISGAISSVAKLRFGTRIKQLRQSISLLDRCEESRQTRNECGERPDTAVCSASLRIHRFEPKTPEGHLTAVRAHAVAIGPRSPRSDDSLLCCRFGVFRGRFRRCAARLRSSSLLSRCASTASNLSSNNPFFAGRAPVPAHLDSKLQQSSTRTDRWPLFRTAAVVSAATGEQRDANRNEDTPSEEV